MLRIAVLVDAVLLIANLASASGLVLSQNGKLLIIIIDANPNTRAKQ